MSKNEILANEIDTNKIELLQDRINNNSKLINDLTNKLVADYCKQLDDYVRFIQSILQDDKHPPTAQELDYMGDCFTLYLQFTCTCFICYCSFYRCIYFIIFFLLNSFCHILFYT